MLTPTFQHDNTPKDHYLYPSREHRHVHFGEPSSMAAQEYYQSFQGRPQQAPAGYSQSGPPRPQMNSPAPSSYSSAPPPYSAVAPPQAQYQPQQQYYPPQQQQQYPPPQQQQYPPRPPPQSQYPARPPLNPYQQRPPSNQLAVPSLGPSRSHSEPPENRRPHRHHKHDSDYSDYSDSDSSHSRTRSRSRSGGRSRGHHKSKPKKGGADTIFGAGAGAIIGDAILPGAGTLGGLLLGGWGGHEHAKNRSKSEIRESRHSKDRDYDYGQKDGYNRGWTHRY